MSWESPLKVIEKEIETKINESVEGAVVLEVERVLSIDIDKKGLQDALAYSENSYNKGYQEGYADMHERHKQKVLFLYTDLLSAFENDTLALKKIDEIFDKPLEEINNG